MVDAKLRASDDAALIGFLGCRAMVWRRFDVLAAGWSVSLTAVGLLEVVACGGTPVTGWPNGSVTSS